MLVIIVPGDALFVLLSSADEAANPERAFNSSFPTVTPFNILSSLVTAVIPLNTFISEPRAVTGIAPKVNEDVVNAPVVSKLPVTFASPFETVINPVLSL